MGNSGAVSDRIGYNAWGEKNSETQPANGDQIGYAGYWYEATVGLYQVWERWYDAATGRWMQKDPMSFAAGDSNLYRTVGNDVTNATDPTGLAETNPSAIFVIAHNKKMDGFGGVPKLGPIAGQDQAKWGFFVQIIRAPGDKGDPKDIKTEQRIWMLATATPRMGSGAEKTLRGNSLNSLWDAQGVSQISDAAAEKALATWSKDGFWEKMFPDATTIKKDTGKKQEEGQFQSWLLDPVHAYDAKKNPTGRVRVVGPTLQYVDNPGFRELPASDYTKVSLRVAVQVTASGPDGTVTAQFWVTVRFKSDGKTWSVDGDPTGSPVDIATKDRGNTWRRKKKE